MKSLFTLDKVNHKLLQISLHQTSSFLPVSSECFYLMLLSKGYIPLKCRWIVCTRSRKTRKLFHL